MSDRKTLSVYASKAAEYAKLTSGEAASPSLLRFISALPKGARTLDLGCGPGFAAGAMAAAGMEAHAWDPVPEMVAMAAARDGVIAREAVYADLSERSAYDGIWCNFSMLHTPLTDWPGQFAAIARALTPGGLLHFGTKLGVGEKHEARDSSPIPAGGIAVGRSPAGGTRSALRRTSCLSNPQAECPADGFPR